MTTTFLIRRGNIREQLTINSMQRDVPYIFGERGGRFYTTTMAKATAMRHVRFVTALGANVVRVVGTTAVEMAWTTTPVPH